MKEFFAPVSYWNTQPHEPFVMFSVGHIIVLVLFVIALTLIVLFRKRFRHDSIRKFLLVMMVVWTSLEIFKIVLYSIVANDPRQTLREVLPLYMCSLYLYCLPFAIFCKGRLKQVGEHTLVTLSLFSGLVTSFNCPVLLSYPVWSFYGLHSLFYHVIMAVTGVLLLVSGYVRLELKKFYYPLIPTLVLAVPAIIMNNAVYTDYMLMHKAWGTPVLDKIAESIGQVPQIFLMLGIYTLLAFLMTALGRLISRTNEKAEKEVA